MPTGINYKIVEGEQPFSEFVWDCARHMGALFHMREERNDAPLRFPDPSPLEAKNYAEIALKREEDYLRDAQKELADAEAKTSEQVEAEYEAHKAERMAEYEESYARKKSINERVLRRRAEVADWQPPGADYEPLKGFMVHQMDLALKHEARLPEKPEFPKTAVKWHSDDIEWQCDYVERLENDVASARARVNSGPQRGHRAWLEDLIASVPPPPGSFEK